MIIDKWRDLFDLYWWFLTLLLLLAISVLSLTPLPELPDYPGGDKLQHILAYFTAVMPLYLTKAVSDIRRKHFIAMIVLFYSGLIELVQPYVNRYAEWLDFAANGMGVVLGALIGMLIFHRWRNS